MDLSYAVVEQDLQLKNATIDQQAIAYHYWYDFAELIISKMREHGTNTR